MFKRQTSVLYKTLNQITTSCVLNDTMHFLVQAEEILKQTVSAILTRFQYNHFPSTFNHHMSFCCFMSQRFWRKVKDINKDTKPTCHSSIRHSDSLIILWENKPSSFHFIIQLWPQAHWRSRLLKLLSDIQNSGSKKLVCKSKLMVLVVVADPTVSLSCISIWHE